MTSIFFLGKPVSVFIVKCVCLLSPGMVCDSCVCFPLSDYGLHMMELAHSLLLNEDALKRISDSKKPVFVFEWLRFLDKVLVAAQKVRTMTHISDTTSGGFLRISGKGRRHSGSPPVPRNGVP